MDSITLAPRGGQHEPDDDGDCKKCLEPMPRAAGVAEDDDLPPPLEDLIEGANEEHRLCETRLRDSLQHAITAGKLLMQAKQLVPHGCWDGYLKRTFKGSSRTARGYMRLAKELPKLPAQNGNAVANLTLRKALASVADSSRRIAKYDKGDQKRILKAWEKYSLANGHQAVCRAEREQIEAENRQPNEQAIASDQSPDAVRESATATSPAEVVDDRHGAVAVVASNATNDQEPFGQLLRDAIQNLWSAHPEVPGVALSDLLIDVAREVMEVGDR